MFAHKRNTRRGSPSVFVGLLAFVLGTVEAEYAHQVFGGYLPAYAAGVLVAALVFFGGHRVLDALACSSRR